MGRIADKLIALACCVPALALAGTGFATTGALLAAAACAFAAELLPDRARPAPALCYCAFACALPVASLFAAPTAYDLARRTPAAALVAAAPAAGALLAGAIAPDAALCGLIAGVVAAVLAVRTETMMRARSRILRRADELREHELRLEARNRDLLDAQDYEVRLATLGERARIAREIHDNVGHLLTRAAVQAEAFRVVHAGEPAERDLAAVAATVREALDEVRSSVHDLRDDATDLSVQVRAVVERACAGTDVAAEVSVEAGEVDAPVAACLVAVVREAVSNTLRHAHARHLRVELVEHPGLWRLTVTDDGAGAGAAGGASGMGLASMEERVRALGGTFRAGPGATGGWTVFASVPRTGRRPA
ncbi:sensor histidine kinase [Bifidobacterium pullorum subsp. saeculare]|uniref:histidine kinase n=1 Tax=Bifidobacterium pullorum subsp. saeculare TaxID=78257 RepID=A0A939BAG4_9BIFI|nr:histidine kinase [Bifidobacterium pullorum]MBM6699861.1 sensor histidine kinase [Bifidobacterium pullorum subsp. saeculare]